MKKFKARKFHLVVEDPNLRLRWHSTKNPDLNPHILTAGSGKSAVFLCPFCGYEYTSVIRRAAKCPACTGRVATSENCLAATNPEILHEWDFEYNGDLTPYNITKNTTKVIGLKCSTCSNSYQKKVHLWVLGERCPYCAGKKIDKSKSLAVKHPDVAADWDFERNGEVTPYDVLPKSHFMAWWKGKCGHVWQTMVFNRTAIIVRESHTYYGTGCPICAGQTKET